MAIMRAVRRAADALASTSADNSSERDA